MPEIQPIQVINIDNIPYSVDAMSETAQRLVAVYNEWNQKEGDIRNELMIIQAAKETLSRQIIEQVRNEKAEEAAETEQPGDPVTDVSPAVEAAPVVPVPVPVVPVPVPVVPVPVEAAPVVPVVPVAPIAAETITEPTVGQVLQPPQ